MPASSRAGGAPDEARKARSVTVQDVQVLSGLSRAELRDNWSALSRSERLAGWKLLGRADAEGLFLSLTTTDQLELVLDLPPTERRYWLRLLEPDDAADLIQQAPEEDR